MRRSRARCGGGIQAEPAAGRCAAAGDARAGARSRVARETSSVLRAPAVGAGRLPGGAPGRGYLLSPARPTSRERPRHGPGPSRTAAPCGCRDRGRRCGECERTRARVSPHEVTRNTDFIKYGLCEPDPRVHRARADGVGPRCARGRFEYGPAERRSGIAPAACRPDPRRPRHRPDRRPHRGDQRHPAGARYLLPGCSFQIPGDRVVVEDLGYLAGAQAVFAAGPARSSSASRSIEHGLGPGGGLPPEGFPVRAVYVTPSHQFPTGAVMPAARRHALLEWAKRQGAYVIEDDYDGECSLSGRPIAALAGLELRMDGVIYMRELREVAVSSYAARVSRRASQDRRRARASGK